MGPGLGAGIHSCPVLPVHANEFAGMSAPAPAGTHPGRHTLGAAFLSVAQSHGLTSAIMDARAPQCVEAVRAGDFLLGRDEWGARWIAAHRAKQAMVT